MKHLIWNYRGYDDLGLNIIHDGMQKDWNVTILSKINEVTESTEEKNIFVSEKYLHIFMDMMGFNEETMKIFNIKIIPLLVNTPKIYVTKPDIIDFSMLDYDNYGSVTIKNYKKK